MSKLSSVWIDFGTGAEQVSSKNLPVNLTPSNYTPSQIGAEGTDKVSAHLKGIDSALASSGGYTTSIKVAITADDSVNYAASNGEELFTNTISYSMIITLPSDPTIGQRVRIIDGKDNWATKNVTVGRNGSNIEGVASNFILNVDGAWIEFIYMDATEGWRTVS